jgi:hypothetical protein
MLPCSQQPVIGPYPEREEWDSESSRKNSHTVSEISGYQSSIVTFWPLLEINSKPSIKKMPSFTSALRKWFTVVENILLDPEICVMNHYTTAVYSV